MRNRFVVRFVMVAVFAFSPRIPAQTPGTEKAVPNLTGIWDAPGNLARRDICGEPSCSALLGVQLPQRGADKNLDEPQMLPWAEEHFKVVRRGLADPQAMAPGPLRPFWGGCTPEGPGESMRRRGFEIVQFPDVVLLLFNHDHAVRRVYMDGRGHPPSGKPTWMGHSIGKYEADTLVVETVGIKDKGWIDAQGHPHTDALRLTERIRRVDRETLEIVMTIDDSKTYARPWRKQITHKLRPPGPDVWDSAECEELLRMGMHYGAEAKK